MKLNFSFKDLFFFNKLITPSVLTYVYWLSCIGIVLFALVSIFGSFALLRYLSFSAWIVAFFTAIISTIVLFISTRIGFELIIIMFNINDNLKKIAEQKSTTVIAPALKLEPQKNTDNVTNNNANLLFFIFI